MEQQLMRHEGAQEELEEVKARLSAAEWQRDRALDELREIKREMSSNESLQNAERDSKMEEEIIESLRSKDEELKSLKVSMDQMEVNLCDSEKKVQELEAEIENRKMSESKLFDSFVVQKSQLEEATASVDKYEDEVASIQQKMEELEEKNQQNVEDLREEIHKVHDEGDKNEDKLVLVKQIEVLKKELKKALEGEEYSKKALDDLAMALKEVTNESIPMKEQLKATERELEVVREEEENFKTLAKCTEKTCEAVLGESAKESDRLKNIVEKLRLEAKESVLAWNEKQEELVACLKMAEAENSIILEENKKLEQSTRKAEAMSSSSEVENRKLRDILKQAVNEANVAKEGATIARDETYNLQHSLKEKDEANVSLAQETERLKINEAEATASIKELKRALTFGSKTEEAAISHHRGASL